MPLVQIDAAVGTGIERVGGARKQQQFRGRAIAIGGDGFDRIGAAVRGGEKNPFSVPGYGQSADFLLRRTRVDKAHGAGADIDAVQSRAASGGVRRCAVGDCGFSVGKRAHNRAAPTIFNRTGNAATRPLSVQKRKI